MLAFTDKTDRHGRRRATFGGGCFWCVEAAFEQLTGVEEVVPGYAGGTVEEPTYRQVCSGTTGHAEVVQVAYEPDEITYVDLLQVFFAIHDPTTEDREGPDVGEQYRSIILYHDDEQRTDAGRFIDELEASDVFDDQIVTEVEPLTEFWEAEEEHHDYARQNPGDAYCRRYAHPKIQKVRDRFDDLVTGP